MSAAGEPGDPPPATPPGAGLKHRRAPRASSQREADAAAPPRSPNPPGRLRTPPRPYFGGSRKHEGRNAGPAGRAGGSAPRTQQRPRRPYRSGSGSPPQCCGPRTRTAAPPSSRQGTPRAALTPRTAGVGSSAQRRPHQRQRQRSVDRAQRCRRECWGHRSTSSPAHPGPSAPAPPRGRAGKRGGAGRDASMCRK